MSHMRRLSFVFIFVLSSMGLFALFFIGLPPITAAVNATTRYVAPASTGTGDCSSWADACTLSSALGVAVSGDEIWVKSGVHLPSSTSNSNDTFTLKSGVAVYGGFAGHESLRSSRNYTNNLTILSGDIDNNDTKDANGIITDSVNIMGSNSYHVVTSSNVDSTAVLDGFTITGGNANSDGGGIYNAFGTPTLNNLTIIGNKAAVDGGGLYNREGGPILTHVTFARNQATNGGGMANLVVLTGIDNEEDIQIGIDESTETDLLAPIMLNGTMVATLNQTTFNQNTATTDGGGLFVGRWCNDGGSCSNVFDWSSINTLGLTVNQSHFIHNTAGRYGGAFSGGLRNLSNTSMPQSFTAINFNQTTFYSNTATIAGGGVANLTFGDTVRLDNSSVIKNHSLGNGGGIYDFLSETAIVNTSIISNTTLGHGGGLYLSDGNPNIMTSTIKANQASLDGGGIYLLDLGLCTIINTTISHNIANGSGGGVHINETTSNASDNGAVQNCIQQSVLESNIAGTNGGGLAFISPDSSGGSRSRLNMLNTIIRGNQATGTGGGAYIEIDRMILYNVVFSGNSAANGGGLGIKSLASTLHSLSVSGNNASTNGGGIYIDSGSPSIANSIIWNNRTAGQTDLTTSSSYNANGATPSFSHTIVANSGGSSSWNNALGTDSGSNLDGDPLFIQAIDASVAPTTAGNLLIGTGSPAESSGVGPLPGEGSGTTDVAGNLRQVGVIDRGAYEKQCDDTTILHVNHAATGANNGTSWADAHTNLQEALSKAALCSHTINEIWVAQGVYTPGSNVTDQFNLPASVNFYGGFAGTETMRSQRDWVNHVTILSGDIGNDDTNTAGVVLNSSDQVGTNSQLVVVMSTSGDTTLDGFTITAGHNNSGASGLNTEERSAILKNLIFSGNHGGGLEYGARQAAELSGLTFTGNFSPVNGGAALLRVEGLSGTPTFTLTNSTFNNNSSAQNGGAIYAYDINLNLENVSFDHNQASQTGGAIYTTWGGIATLRHITVTNGIAGSGGAIYAKQPIIVENSTFTQNFGNYGGAFYHDNTTATYQGIVATQNVATADGGAMYNRNAVVTVNGSTIKQSTGSNGGSIYNESSTLTLNSSTIQQSTAINNGGALFNGKNNFSVASVVTLDSSYILSSTGKIGGGIYNDIATLTLTNSQIISNTATAGNGGGIYNNTGEWSITNSTFARNKTSDSGGGLYDQVATFSSYTIIGSIFQENRAVNNGGGLYFSTYGTAHTGLTLNNTAFKGNEATRGGGVYLQSGSFVMPNLVFSGNKASNSGGGLYLGSTLTKFYNNTFTGNSAGVSGGGVFNFFSLNNEIVNSILWNNRANGVTGSASANLGFHDGAHQSNVSHSIVQGGAGAGVSNIDADPLFMTAVDPATAPTTAGDLRLMLGSPGINSGNTAGYNGATTVATDLFGITRVQGGTIDRGAYETLGNATLTLTQSGQTDVQINWPDPGPACTYQIYEATTPYFTPSMVTYANAIIPQTANGKVGNPATNYFYIVVANCTGGNLTSTRAGVFDFALTPGQ